MSENVTIPYGDNAEDTAVLLLAAAEEMGLPAATITTGSYGNFYAPRDLADKAGVDYIADDAVDNPVDVTPDSTERAEPERYLTGSEDADSAFDPSDHTVAEVQEYLDANPDQYDSVIAAERAGKNRVSLTESQE